MIRKVLTGVVAIFIAGHSFAQEKQEITPKNSWLKAGLSASVPVGDISDYSSFALGLEVSGQLMATNNLGVGIASGYTHFFGKENVEDFGTVPLGLLLRYYPQAQGVFVGTDAGYSFLTNANNSSGGVYIKPQVGYHNYNWNIYGFYNHVFRKEGYIDLQNVGLAATYNIRFK